MTLKAEVFDFDFVQLSVFTACDSSSVRAEKILFSDNIHAQKVPALIEGFFFFFLNMFLCQNFLEGFRSVSVKINLIVIRTKCKRVFNKHRRKQKPVNQMKEGKGRSFRRTLDSELLTKAFLGHVVPNPSRLAKPRQKTHFCTAAAAKRRIPATQSTRFAGFIRPRLRFELTNRTELQADVRTHSGNITHFLYAAVT